MMVKAYMVDWPWSASGPCMVKYINALGIIRMECISSIYVFHYQVGKVGYNNLISLRWYCGGTSGGITFKCKWSKPSQRRVVVVDQPQECKFFFPLMFFTNVVLASFECFLKTIYISDYSKYNY